MEIVFEAKKCLHIVNRHDKRPTLPKWRDQTPTKEEAMETSDDKNATAHMPTSKSISHKILAQLSCCRIANCMWKKLSALYLKKIAENVFYPSWMVFRLQGATQ